MRAPSFLMMSEHLHVAEIQDFCEQQLGPVLGKLDSECPYVFGQDFGRKRDFSVFWPLAIRKDPVLRTPFVLEMRNVPYEAQSDNPFRPGSALHTLWQEGWQEARDYHDPVLIAP